MTTETPKFRSAREVECPACFAKPGEPCNVPSHTKRGHVTWFHGSRIDRALTPSVEEQLEAELAAERKRLDDVKSQVVLHGDSDDRDALDALEELGEIWFDLDDHMWRLNPPNDGRPQIQSWNHGFTQHMYREVILGYMQRTIFCATTREILDIDTCLVWVDSDGDPVAVASPSILNVVNDAHLATLAGRRLWLMKRDDNGVWSIIDHVEQNTPTTSEGPNA